METTAVIWGEALTRMVTIRMERGVHLREKKEESASVGDGSAERSKARDV